MLEHFKGFLRLLAMTGILITMVTEHFTLCISLVRELALTGRKFDAKEALEMGFVR